MKNSDFFAFAACFSGRVFRAVRTARAFMIFARGRKL